MKTHRNIIKFLVILFFNLNSWAFSSTSLQFNLDDFLPQIEQIDLYDSSCKKEIDKISGSFFQLEDLFETSQIQMSEKELITISFNKRIKLKEYIDSLTVIKKINYDCWIALRKLTYSMKNYEDRLIYEITKSKTLKNKQYKEFSGQGWHFFKNKKMNFTGLKDLKSGDLILSIGNDIISAGTAMIGRPISSFSHLSMLYKKENGEFVTIEAHGDFGVKVRPLQAHLDEKDQISVLLRNKDYGLANKAAKLIYDRVLLRQNKNKVIDYDFNMDLDNNERLFCSEVIYQGYLLATDNHIKISPYMTTFKKGQITFLKKFGLNISQENYKSFYTFGPGDLIWDPDFDLIAEWKNPNGVESTKIKGIIARRIFDWINDYDYQIKTTKFNKVAPKFAVKIRKIPYYNFKTKNKRHLLDKMFSGILKSKQISLYLMVDYLGEILEKEVIKKRKSDNRFLSYNKISTLLDKIRVKDLEKYRKYLEIKRVKKKKKFKASRKYLRLKKALKKTKPLFHKYFMPKELEIHGAY